jgi:hypothetical protein
VTAQTDLDALLARARQLADADRCSSVAVVAAPKGENQQANLPRKSTPTPATAATVATGWTPEDWRHLFHERAGFLEHDCHLSRVEAEQRATHELEAQWMALHAPAPSDPQNGCVQCRKGAGAADLLPRLARNKSHLWLHRACWPAYEKTRRAEARSALVRIIPDLHDPLEKLLVGEPA